MLTKLIQKCWTDFLQKKQMAVVVKPSIPILWFGNMAEYAKSKLKIVTVGLNPSLNEFINSKGQSPDVKLRFPNAPVISSVPLSALEISAYEAALNSYFDVKPYLKWFSYNEKVLSCLDASYKAGKNNRAIHIDLYTPIATNPTWGKLYIGAKSILQQNCQLNFIDLLTILDPDVIVISANFHDVDNTITHWNVRNLQSFLGVSEYYQQIKQGNSHSYIAGFKLQGEGKEMKIIWGSNYRGNPFGAINKQEIIAPMQAIRKSLGINVP